jgi:predicted nuclease of predicted toxin-antitoxin system
MRFLADESCDFAVVQALRQAGHDVSAIAELSPSLEDSDVLKLASDEARILLTEDKDFGRLVYAGSVTSVGVIFFRFPASARTDLTVTAVKLVEEMGERLRGRFVVVRPGRVRIGGEPRG